MPLESSFSAVVDFTNVKESSGFNPVHQPAGDYRGVVKDVIEGESKQGNKTVTFAISDVDRPSATYRYICTFSEKSLWKLRALLVAAGKAAPKKKVKLSAAALNALIGKEIGMSLDDNEYEGKMSSQIVGVFPADDLPSDDDDATSNDATDDEDTEDEAEEAPPAKKSTKAKATTKKAAPAPAAEDEDEEDLDELDIDDL